jgi:hypothetical protein
MKKSLLIGLFGVSAMAAFGQGQITFGNYYSPYQTTGIYFANGPDATGYVGSDQSVTITLLYGASTDTLIGQLGGSLATGAGISTPYTGVTVGNVPSAYEGLFVNYTTPINALTAAATYAFSYEVQAVVGAVTYTGYSTIWTQTTTASSTDQGSIVEDHGNVGLTGTIVPTPEPSSLALAGLGGFGMLMAFRRKKA